MSPTDSRSLPCTDRPGLVAVIRRELARILSRRICLLLLFVFPLVSFILVAAIFNAGMPRKLPVGIYDADNSAFSRRLVRLLDANPSLHVACRATSLAEGKQMILSGRCYALIVLQRDLERNLSRQHGTEVINYYNNQYMLAGSLINRGVRDTLRSASSELNQGSRQQRGEMPVSARVHAEPIRMESRALFNPYLNYLYFLVSALMPIVFQIFILVVSVYAVGVELKEGTAKDWLETAAGAPWKAVVGKLAPYTAGFLPVAALMNASLFLYLDVPLLGSVTLICLATILLVLTYQSVGVLFVTLTANLRLALSLSAVYAAPAFAYSGITFPVMAMPWAARLWGAILPINYYLLIFVDQAMRGAPVAISVPYLAAMTGFVIIPVVLALPRLGKLMRDERYWGRT